MTKTKAQKAKAKRARKGPQPGSAPAKKRKRNRAKAASSGGGFAKIKGRGDYNVMQTGNLGEHIGQAAGGLISQGMNKFWNWITGKGAYNIRKNTLVSGRPPLFQSRMGMDGSMEFAHSEFLQDISGSVNFTLQQFFVNPGLFSTFPYLSNLASHFEQYEMMGLVFQFKSTSANALNSTNTALGVVIMSTEYDVLDLPFANKQQMEAYMFTTSCAPSDSMVHPIECAPRANVLTDGYVRTDGYPTGADPRFYDLGNFQIATVGMQAAAVIGELWVSYHVRLKKPKLPTPSGSHLTGAHGHESTQYTATAAQPFGTAPDSDVGRTYAGTTLYTYNSSLPSPTGSDYFIIPKVGRYLVALNWVSNVVLTAPSTVTLGANLSFSTFFAEQAEYEVKVFGAPASGGAAVEVGTHLVIINCNKIGYDTDNRVTVVGPTGLTAGACDFTVSQISAGLLADLSVRSPNTARANFLDDLASRLERAESKLALMSLKDRANKGSITDDEDWKCRSSSSSVPLKKPGVLPSLESTIDKAKSESRLSDSVVNLIASKLRQ